MFNEDDVFKSFEEVSTSSLRSRNRNSISPRKSINLNSSNSPRKTPLTRHSTRSSSFYNFKCFDLKYEDPLKTRSKINKKCFYINNIIILNIIILFYRKEKGTQNKPFYHS